MIAHRLPTIRSADQILVMEGGEIVERGTHDELLVRDGRYRQLYDKEYKLETNRFINPGEDWTPEAPKPIPMKPASGSRVSACGRQRRIEGAGRKQVTTNVGIDAERGR